MTKSNKENKTNKENEANKTENVEAINKYTPDNIIQECYKKYGETIKEAKQFKYCELPAIPYVSKASFGTSIDTLKRMNNYNKSYENFEMSIEMLEKAIAYLYHRKING